MKAILNLRAAQAYCQTTQVKETRGAIETAYEALRDQPSDSGEPAWSYWMDEAQANEQVGYCYMRLEDWGRARNHLRSALQLGENSGTREAALRQTLFAITYARQGDPEQACHIGRRAVDVLASKVDSDRCVGHVRRLQDALNPYRKLGAVTEFNELVAH